jgi:uncharacterized membrane protein
MTSVPLHPAIVHIPLGLAFILPALAIGFAWALWTGRSRPRAWLVIVALQALVFGAGLVAANTGEREEERVESVVPDAAMERHEEYAEQFLWAAGMTLALAGSVLILRRPGAVRLLTAASVAGTVAVAAAGIRVGHAGGQLVYVHNAGSAYGSGVEAARAPSAVPSADRVHDDR